MSPMRISKIYIRVSNRSHRKSLIVARCRQILFKRAKILRGIFIFTMSSKNVLQVFDRTKRMGDNDFLDGKKIIQGMSCDPFSGRTHAHRTPRFTTAHTHVRTLILKWSHTAPAHRTCTHNSNLNSI